MPRLIHNTDCEAKQNMSNGLSEIHFNKFYSILFPDGIVSYNMPQGDRRGAEVDLYDFTYDGTINDGYLSGGLGQLTDGQEGNTNFRSVESIIYVKEV